MIVPNLSLTWRRLREAETSFTIRYLMVAEVIRGWTSSAVEDVVGLVIKSSIHAGGIFIRFEIGVGSEITWDSPKYEKRLSISVPSVVVLPAGHHSCD